MRIIQEYKSANEIGFEIKYFNDKKLVFIEDISHSSVIYEEEGRTYLLLYDSNMNPIHEVFCFLNDEILKQSINSRIKSMNAVTAALACPEIDGCFCPSIAENLAG